VSLRPVSYIDKSREYYAAQGYLESYRWANNDDVPFTALPRPLSQCRVGLITTTGLLGPGESPEADAGLRAPKAAFAAPSDPVPGAMYTRDLSWDKDATHTGDVESFLPIQALQVLVSQCRIGSASERFYGVPTEYSQRCTSTVDAPEVLRLCREDRVDVALLIPV
jgi:D-proline reductase (dithiol) PrdB